MYDISRLVPGSDFYSINGTPGITSYVQFCVYGAVV